MVYLALSNPGYLPIRPAILTRWNVVKQASGELLEVTKHVEVAKNRITKLLVTRPNGDRISLETVAGEIC